MIRLFPWLAVAACLVLVQPLLPCASQVAWAEDEEEDDDELDEPEADDEFETLFIGLRLGVWYRPEINMDVAIGGDIGGGGLIPTEFDVERQLGVTQNVHSDYELDIDDQAVPELEFVFDSEWISFTILYVPPYEYQGEKVLTQDINYGGQTFSASDTISSTFRQFYGGFNLTLNIFNNRYFRISPVIGIRVLAVDWTLEDELGGLKATTSDIDSPIKWEGFQILPYPEVGLDVRVGYRDFIEAQVKLTGVAVNYLGFEGAMYHAEVNVIFYPIPYVGLQVGYRLVSWQFESISDTNEKLFDIDMGFQGFTAGLIVRL